MKLATGMVVTIAFAVATPLLWAAPVSGKELTPTSRRAAVSLTQVAAATARAANDNGVVAVVTKQVKARATDGVLAWFPVHQDTLKLSPRTGQFLMSGVNGDPKAPEIQFGDRSVSIGPNFEPSVESGYTQDEINSAVANQPNATRWPQKGGIAKPESQMSLAYDVAYIATHASLVIKHGDDYTAVLTWEPSPNSLDVHPILANAGGGGIVVRFHTSRGRLVSGSTSEPLVRSTFAVKYRNPHLAAGWRSHAGDQTRLEQDLIRITDARVIKEIIRSSNADTLVGVNLKDVYGLHKVTHFFDSLDSSGIHLVSVGGEDVSAITPQMLPERVAKSINLTNGPELVYKAPWPKASVTCVEHLPVVQPDPKDGVYFFDWGVLDDLDVTCT